MVAAHELGLADRIRLRRTVVRMSAPNAELMRDNPLSKIPTLVLDDGTVLIESGVICEYLDDLAGGGIILPAERSRCYAELSRHALASGLLDLLILWRNERDKPAEKQTAAWLASFDQKLHATLRRCENDVVATGDGPLQLSGIALGCCLSYLDFRFADIAWRAGHPSLAAWHAAFSARPSALATAIIDDA